MNAPRGWNPKTPEELAEEQAKQSVAQEWLALHAAVFASGPGRDLLEKYHAMLVDTYAPRDASADELRFRDAQRALIVTMQRLTARAMTVPKPTKT